MTDFLKIAKSIVVHFAHICAYGVETVNHRLDVEINDITQLYSKQTNHQFKGQQLTYWHTCTVLRGVSCSLISPIFIFLHLTKSHIA